MDGIEKERKIMKELEVITKSKWKQTNKGNEEKKKKERMRKKERKKEGKKLLKLK